MFQIVTQASQLSPTLGHPPALRQVVGRPAVRHGLHLELRHHHACRTPWEVRVEQAKRDWCLPWCLPACLLGACVAQPPSRPHCRAASVTGWAGPPQGLLAAPTPRGRDHQGPYLRE